MTLFRKPTKLIATIVVVATAILFVACTEKSEDSTQTETVVSTVVTEDKIAQLQREAREGDPDAQYELAYLYENGLGVPKDETRALELYQQAADQGHPEAQANIDARSNSE